MKRTWRDLAFGLLTATLSLGIAACDDDTTKTNVDMAMSVDMSATIDMAMGTPGNGQVTLADVAGTVYTTQAAPRDKLYRTHTLLALASMPVIAGTPDPSSDFGLTPTIHGCSIYRYNATNLPGADGDGGIVAISGYDTATTIAVDANGSSTYPLTSPIACKRIPPPAGVNSYVCFYPGMGSPDSGAAGMPTSDVIFPMFPHQVILVANGMVLSTISPAMGGWPLPDGACTNRRICGPGPVAGTAIVCCEQSPIPGQGVAVIAESNTGGTDYPAKSSMLGNGGGTDGGLKQFPGPLSLVSVTQPGSATNVAGTDPITGGPSLSMDAPLDKTKDVVITFSCDGTATAGSGCAGSGDLAALLIKTSTSVRTMFGTTTASGVGQCASPVAVPSGTMTIKAAQLTAALGGQTGGSIQLALARLAVDIQPDNGHLLVFTAGMGIFGFTNQ
jgi:hypothetical protein